MLKPWKQYCKLGVQKNQQFCAVSDLHMPFSLGQFLWSGFDYIGEPTPYQSRNSFFGQIDTAGFPKDAYYFYQSVWTDAKTKSYDPHPALLGL